MPVIDREPQTQLFVHEIDALRDEHRALAAFRRELIAGVVHLPKTLLERRERAGAAGLGARFEIGIGKAEQPRVQARDR